MPKFRIFATALVALVVALVAAGLTQRLAGGLSIDLLYVLREAVYGPRPGPASKPVALVAIDEETYRRAPFADTPRALWTPMLGKVIDAIDSAGVAVIGVDMINSTTVEAMVRGYERDYLLALRKAGRAGHLVLAKAQFQTQPLLPYRSHVVALGGTVNIRSANLDEDEDGILRRVPLLLDAVADDGSTVPEPALAAELVSRVLKVPFVRTDDGISLNGAAVPLSGHGGMLLNHPTAADAFPQYSLADLFACAEAGNAEWFEKQFRGKIVLIGTALDIEDRKLSSNRWVTKPEGMNIADRCVHPPMRELYRADLRRDTVPGVTLHAAAITNLLSHDALREWSPGLAWISVLGLALAAAAATGILAPVPAIGAILGLIGIWTTAAVAAFHGGILLPWLPGVIAAVVSFPALVVVRFAIVDRDRRQIQQVFRLYLPANIIDEMIESGGMPRLGGESRDISVLFSDIAGYTKMSEGMDPEALVRLLNAYFTVMTNIIESHGGFVDKFIGDAILAVFGAPYCPHNHAEAAVAAAIEMQAALRDNPALLDPGAGHRGAARIGIATGPALIGNIGSPRRFNYTVMGDTVNLASRLEGANKYFATGILVSGATAEMCADPSRFREVDRIAVVGRVEPVTVLEPLAPERREDAADRTRRTVYAEALGHWRAGRFEVAAQVFGAIADEDKVAAAMQARALRYATHPPAERWTGVTSLTEK